jgi:hypothetical protein
MLVSALVLASHSIYPHTPPFLLADFEAHSQSVQFSSGPEFPGATGRLELSSAAAHHGQSGLRLHFDFTQGGQYVAVILQPSQPPDQIAQRANALDAQIRRPSGHELALRYTDTAGQTFQKPIECPPDQWVHVVVPFDAWTGHWGGPNDGRVQGGPVRLALLVQAGASSIGYVDIDHLQLVQHQDPIVQVEIPVYRFAPEEGWTLRPHGPAGDSQLQGRILRLDFRHGARAFSLMPPDRTLPGTIDTIQLRVFGSLRDLPIQLRLRTHFMTFHRSLGSLHGDGHLEILTPAPPGPDWHWSGGENDGKLHGPLRLGEIRFDRPAIPTLVELELEEILVQASCPASKRCLITAATLDSPNGPQFEFSARTLTQEPLEANLHWTLRNWEGESIGRGHRPITLAPLAHPVRTLVPVPDPHPQHLRFIEAEFRLDAPGQMSSPVHAAWVAPLQGNRNATLHPESPFGMGAYLYRYPDNEAGFAEMERAAVAARNAGVKWTREEFQWARIEPQRGNFQWSFYDRMIDTANVTVSSLRHRRLLVRLDRTLYHRGD